MNVTLRNINIKVQLYQKWRNNMKKTTTFKLPAGQIIEVKRLEDGTYEVLIEVDDENEVKSELSDSDFILIDAEKLSMNDKFMQYEPKYRIERETKDLISEAIQKGVKNFYRPRGDVSFTADGNGLCYAPGKMPAVDKSFNWHEKAAKNFMPERNSRLGSKYEYGAFEGVLIKKLVAEGKTVETAWHEVCCDSRKLGHFADSENAKYDFEPTGSREICGFCDLGNAYKILARDDKDDGFWLAGGNCYHEGYESPIADLVLMDCDAHDYESVGWVVFS